MEGYAKILQRSLNDGQEATRGVFRLRLTRITALNWPGPLLRPPGGFRNFGPQLYLENWIATSCSLNGGSTMVLTLITKPAYHTPSNFPVVSPSHEYRVIGVNDLTVRCFYGPREAPLRHSKGGGGGQDAVFATVMLEVMQNTWFIREVQKIIITI